MSHNIHCLECGADLPPGAPEGLCPKCLLTAGWESRGSEGKPVSRSAAATAPNSASFVPPDLAWLAAHFPHLELLELVGQGGMGAVYKARQRNLDRLVALKIIRTESANDPAYTERFNREARTLARLSHPHIVAVYDFGEVTVSEGGARASWQLYFFLMEFVEGASLRQLMRGGQLTPEQALAIVPQVCEALQFAHDEGVVHRDIKPENILIDKHGRVKIADFGLAKLISHSPEAFTLTATHQLMGTPRYMAPEQMEGAHSVDHRADIYSLGVVFYEMLTGEVPAGHFDPPSKKVQVDVRLDEVVLRALAREPERRYQHANDVKTGVESISHDRRIPGHTPGSSHWVTRVVRDWQAAGLVFIPLALVAGAAFWWWQNTTDDTSAKFRGADVGRTLQPERPDIEGPDLVVTVVDAKGDPLPDVNCRVIVGGYPSDERGRPRTPQSENIVEGTTNERGTLPLSHDALKNGMRHIIYLNKNGYSSETKFLDKIDPRNKELHAVLFKRQYVTLRYVFQTRDTLSFEEEGIVEGQMVLYPMEGGSYRPPARAHFNLAENRRVGSGGVLEASTPGIEIDQQQGRLYFGGSRGRFDHCTDLGRVDFSTVVQVNPDALERKREDTPIEEGHTYIYESNIYEPRRRTKFTGFDVRYAKIFVERIDSAEVPTELVLSPDPARAGERVSVSYHPGSDDLHGARELQAYWAAFDSDDNSLIKASEHATHAEFPADSRGTGGGDFRLGRKRCRIEQMTAAEDGCWNCEFDVPAQAKTLALLFVDELGRTSSGGIRTVDVQSK